MEKTRDMKRITCRVDRDTFNHLQHFATKHSISVNEYLLLCITRQLNFENGDFDLPSATDKRLNQLVDGFKVLSDNVKSLEDIVISGFDSLVNLTKGDNYLLEEGDEDV